MRNFGTYLLLATVLFAQSSLVNSIKVNNDGGYEVLLAIDEGTPEPTGGVTGYVQNIMVSLRDLSSKLFLRTNSTFYLKTVDILLPSNWNSDYNNATTQSYQAADIRISTETTHPHAENPYACGQPGNAIDLPQSFFNNATHGPFGVHAKSLLHLWALYRFGVHPEHGHLGDLRYPYSHWDRENEQLSITGCSDEPIKGNFVDITNADATCDSEESASNENCRFVPDAQGQNATTSLMFFHFINTVEHFCDSHNHNKHAQNQQNDLCDHKSVWEVIRETADYRAVTAARLVQPPTAINVVKTNPAPLLYVLLDRGQIQGSLQLVNRLSPVLAQFMTREAINHNIASIGAFPGRNGSPIEELVPWSAIGQNLNAFLDTIGFISNNGPLERDFSRALVAVADEIKQKNHPNGAVVLVVKYGADVASIGSHLPESEVLNALGEANIVLHSIELAFPDHGLPHLAPLCRGTGGGYAVLDAPGEVELNANFVLSFVQRMMEGHYHYEELHREWKMIHKDTLSSTATAIRLASNIKGTFQVFVSSPNGGLTSTNFTVSGTNRTSGTQHPLTFQLRKSQDYNEGESKHTYLLEIKESDLVEISTISLLTTCFTNCANGMLARAEFTGDINKVKIDVHTSVEDNVADLSSGRPVSIFAKVTKSGVPVDNARVIAHLKSTTTSIVTSIPLTDDGLSTPDVQTGDGIYSAFFAPATDGQFELSVSVQQVPAPVPTSPKVGHSIQLLPIDQEGDLGCGAGNCNSEKLEDGFSQAVDISAFSVIRTAEYMPTPTKIWTLSASNSTNDRVYFDWLSPVIPGRRNSVTSYELRAAPEYELLVTNFDEQAVVPIPPNFFPGPPAGLDSITIAKPSTTTYYALRSVYFTKKSVTSNIVEVVVERTVNPSPTPPSSSTEGNNGAVGMAAFSGMTVMAVAIVFLKSLVL